MSKDCFSNIPHHFQDLLIADLFSLLSFIVSQPLYFAYLLFFLPYIVQFLSFLSPLLLSTSILFLSLLTISPYLEKPTRYGFLVNACQKVVDALDTRIDDDIEFYLFEPLASMAAELEALIALETTSWKGEEDPVVVEGAVKDSIRVDELEEFATLSCGNSISMVSSQSLNYKLKEELVENSREIDGFGAYKTVEVLGNSGLEKLSMVSQGLTDNVGEKPINGLQQNEELEASKHQELKISSLGSLGCKSKTRSVVPQLPTCSVGEKAIGIPQQKDELGAYEHQEHKILSFGCESQTRSNVPQGLTSKVEENLVQVIDRNGKEDDDVMGLNYGGFGSMRREKEWKRTLACKLFEERQSADGIEGMDLLWEVHEVDSGKAKAKYKVRKAKKEEIIDHYEEEEEEIDSQLCCLQALRFSTGKMNLGMGRLNSMRISKAFKGIGLFVRREKKTF